jgi:hypothetical protein
MPIQMSAQFHHQGNVRRLFSRGHFQQTRVQVGDDGNQFVPPALDFLAMVVSGNGDTDHRIAKQSQQSLRALGTLIVGIDIQRHGCDLVEGRGTAFSGDVRHVRLGRHGG